MTNSFRKILIRGVNWIGDAVLTTPAIKAVRKHFPDAFISLLVKPWVADIFKNNPDINEIILYEEKFNSFTGKLKLARILRARGFQTAILFQNAFDAAFITRLAGIPERIGYRTDFRRLLLTKSVPIDKDILKQHHLYYYLNLLKESLNIAPGDIEPCIYLDTEEISEARNLLDSSLATRLPRGKALRGHSSPVIGINPGAAYGSAKRWMPEKFVELIKKATNELNAKIVLFGSSTEAEMVRLISSQLLLPPSYLLNLAGKTSLRQLAALISECDVLITNDSGPMHMASALSVPVIAIFGSTDSTTTGPFGEGHKTISKDIPCAPCFKRECPVDATRFREGHLRCMADISPEDVFKYLKELVPGEKTVFLDRDGTLNEDVGYLNTFGNLKIFKDAVESLNKLKRNGFKLIGITNQSGIARGLISEEFVQASNTYIQKTLGIDDFYFCPHLPDNGCQCRKPNPLLARKARLKHGLNFKTSYVIGDKEIDILLAKEIGARSILVLTGHDKKSDLADFTALDLKEAVDWILKDSSQ